MDEKTLQYMAQRVYKGTELKSKIQGLQDCRKILENMQDCGRISSMHINTTEYENFSGRSRRHQGFRGSYDIVKKLASTLSPKDSESAALQNNSFIQDAIAKALFVIIAEEEAKAIKEFENL